MTNDQLRNRLLRDVLPHVQTPGQYIGGEHNSVVKDPAGLAGRLCLAFPDAYTIGTSNHGMQVLYAAVNRLDDWACERVFTPWPDMERLLREKGLPLASLETCTPLGRFDVLGFSLQYELCATNVLTMLDLAGIPLHAEDRTDDHPLVVAGGPWALTPEPMAPFIDLFVLGDGEEALPEVCRRWGRLKEDVPDRVERIARMAVEFPFVYAPRFYRALVGPDGRPAAPEPTRPDLPKHIQPAVVADLDATPLPSRPVVPWIESVHDRIALEIMRGCPWQCRFCQGTSTKRPLRFRSVESIVSAALEAYHNTGYNEISLLSLSTSDYPHFRELMNRLHETFRPLNVGVSLPSLRINEFLSTVSELLATDRRAGLTIAPEAARDDMRQLLGKSITNEDLYEGCRGAFTQGFQRMKLYFMCGLPGERTEDLDGILDMAATIRRIGKESSRLPVTIVTNVSNLVTKPHTPLQWHGMADEKYFERAHRHLRQQRQSHGIRLNYHELATSLLEGLLSRGDRRVAGVIESAWRFGARFDAWRDHHRNELWQDAIRELAIDVDALVHTPYPTDAPLPWDHVGTRLGRSGLLAEAEQARAIEVGMSGGL